MDLRRVRRNPEFTRLPKSSIAGLMTLRRRDWSDVDFFVGAMMHQQQNTFTVAFIYGFSSK
jgi:hypothetical protein